ncbi:MAG TPA: CHAT domain-containing protein, partial [Thermoanaerobaculia bacterium]|nr:CHAT domain-containing protein [Thermoanaerobaculia bacterium]
WRVVQSSAGARTLRVDVVGLIPVRGTPGRTIPVQQSWILQLELRGEAWKIRSASRAERVLARTLLNTPDERERERILAENPDIERAQISGGIVRELARSAPPYRPDAEQWFLYAEEMARNSGSLADESNAVMALTMYQTTVGRPAESLANARRGLDLARQSGDVPSIVAALWIVAQSGDDFFGSMREAVAMIDQLPDPRVALRMQTVLINGAENDVTFALAESDRLAMLARHYEWPEGELNAQLHLTAVYGGLRNYDVALTHAQNAYRRAQSAKNDITAAIALHEIALMYFAMGDAGQGIETMRRSVIEADRHLTVPQQAITWRDLGTALMQQRSLTDAEAALTRALARAEPRTGNPLEPAAEGTVRMRLSELRFLQGRHQEAEEQARRAAAILVATDDVESLIDAQVARARALRALGNRQEALAELENGIALIESRLEGFPGDELGRTAFLDDYTEPFTLAVDLLFDAGRIEEALLLGERMRARELRDIQARGNVDLSMAMSEPEKAEEQKLQQKIVALTRERRTAGADAPRLERDLEAARVELRSFRGRLYVEHPELRVRRGGDGDQVRLTAPPPGTAVVSFIVGERRTIVFAVTRGSDGTAVVRAKPIAITRTEIGKRVARFVRQIHSRDLHYGQTAGELYSLLLGPIAKELAPQRQLSFVPHDVLWNVPMHALRDETGAPLVRRVAIAYAPSIAFAAEARPLRAGVAPRLLAIANPDVDAPVISRTRSLRRMESVGALPDAEREAAALVSMYGPERSRLYAGAAARESTFKREAPLYDILHIATHGFVDDGNPMYSALVMSAATDAPDEDGLLEAREIVGLDLHAELAVLSACETARGKVGRGEGVIGLTWAFLAAGCPRTVVSQWKAESAATADLMIAFHRRLRDGDDPAEALRAAQLALMRKPGYEHPFYWAPFIVVEAAR